MTIPDPSPYAQRALAPDLARGMMLLGIALANVSIYLWGHDSANLSAHPIGESPFDTWLASGIILLIDGHVYPMFAFLFGYAITQFSVSRINRGVPAESVARMLVRRHLWMLVFGAVHAALLFGGDILGAYALTGFVLAPLLLRGADRTLRIVLWSLGAVVVGLLVLTMGTLLLIGAVLPLDIMSSTEATAGTDALIPNTNDLMSGIDNWWLAMLVRIVWWITSSVGAVLSLIVPFAALLGGFAARYRWLEGAPTRFSLARVAFVGVGVGIVGALPAALGHLGVLTFDPLSEVAWFIGAQLAGIAGGLGYAALFALIGARVTASNGMVRVIAAVGQRSLTFYLLQSLIFAPIFAAWGFGLGSQVGTGVALAVACGVWMLSLVCAWALDRSGRRGPAEVLLRSLTYGSDDTARKPVTT